MYPHPAIAIISIAKLWIITGIILVGCYIGIPELPEELKTPAKGFAILLAMGSILFAMHRLLHYSNTYITITKDALIYREGWIPSTTDNIFWVNIKDINTECSIAESLLKTGSIIVVVAIRTDIYKVRIRYLSDHETIAKNIREHIGTLNEGARQVTYT